MRHDRTARRLLLLLGLGVGPALSAQSGGTAWVRHLVAMNGRVEGSVQLMTAENVALDGSATVTGELLVPGMPTVTLNGHPDYGGTIEGTGSAAPSGYQVTINGRASVRHVVRRVDPVTLPEVRPPPLPAGWRSVTVGSFNRDPGSFETLRDLTLEAGAGPIQIPPGIYGDIVVRGGGLVLGRAGDLQPACYGFQHLAIDGNAWLDVAGPVELTLSNGLTLSGHLGSAGNPKWLRLKFAAGGVTVKGGGTLFGRVTAPGGAVELKGNSRMVGSLVCDRLSVNGNGSLELIPFNVPPVVTLTAPVDGAELTAPAAVVLAAAPADPDGTIARVEFFQGATRVGECGSAPYRYEVNGLAGGLYTFTARAFDDCEAATESEPVHVVVKEASQPLAITLTAPANDAVVAAPGALVLTASAVGGSGGVARVEFFVGAASLGVVATPPYAVAWPGAGAGAYVFTAVATDGSGRTAVSEPVTVRVRQGLPFSADFEVPAGYVAGTLAGQVGWSASDGVIVNAQAAQSGAMGVWLPPAPEPVRVEHEFAPPSGGEPVVFVDFFARPVAAADAETGVVCEVGGARIAFVKLGGAGVFHVFNGDGGGSGAWQRVQGDYPVSVSASGMADWATEIGVRFDFGRKTWDLFVDGLMLSADVGLVDARASSVSRFSLFGQKAQPVTFDLFSIGFENLAFADADRDGMDDSWEAGHGLDPGATDRDGDSDHDELANVWEFVSGTDPRNADTDGDGLADGFEVKHHFDPLSYTFPTDEDEDGLTQIEEAVLGTDPTDYYNGETPVISLVGAEGPVTGEVVFRVQRPDGTPCTRAPVTFAVAADTACFATNSESTITHQMLRLRTDADGCARVFLRRPPGAESGAIPPPVP